MNVIVKKSRRRTISLKVTTNGELQVNCPLYFTNKDIERFIFDKQEWIAKTKLKIEQKHQSKKDFFEYNKILLNGVEYQVTATNTSIKIGEYTIKKQPKHDVKTALKKWLQNYAKAFVLKRLREISTATNIKFNEAKITSARTKWGSCKTTKQIRLNFRLVMLPKECLDYVCIHELCHTLQMNHSKKFWMLVNTFCPNYKQIKKIINSYNFVLELF